MNSYGFIDFQFKLKKNVKVQLIPFCYGSLFSYFTMYHFRIASLLRDLFAVLLKETIIFLLVKLFE